MFSLFNARGLSFSLAVCLLYLDSAVSFAPSRLLPTSIPRTLHLSSRSPAHLIATSRTTISTSSSRTAAFPLSMASTSSESPTAKPVPEEADYHQLYSAQEELAAAERAMEDASEKLAQMQQRAAESIVELKQMQAAMSASPAMLSDAQPMADEVQPAAQNSAAGAASWEVDVKLALSRAGQYGSVHSQSVHKALCLAYAVAMSHSESGTAAERQAVGASA